MVLMKSIKQVRLLNDKDYLADDLNKENDKQIRVSEAKDSVRDYLISLSIR